MSTTDEIVTAAEKRLAELKPALDEAERLRAVIAAAKGQIKPTPTVNPPTFVPVPCPYPSPAPALPWWQDQWVTWGAEPGITIGDLVTQPPLLVQSFVCDAVMHSTFGGGGRMQ